MSSIYDNWERLVAATLKREQLREIALCESFSSIASDISFESFSEDVAAGPSNIRIPSYSGNDSCKSLPTSKAVAEVLSSSKPARFSYKELKNATRNFGPGSLIAEGPSAYVFKGWINEHNLTAAKLGSGLVIAVKMFKPKGSKGYKEWWMEVNYMGQLRHPNIVKLIGYCFEHHKGILVYEFLQKGSLDNHLFRREPQLLSWATRIKVAIGAARALSFLHDAEEQVIHRDFKASNILLDKEFNAKLSHFGLAKEGPTGDRTHVLTQVVATYGYAAPEYLATGRLTAKCDVYSFGVVLLELLSGRRVIDRTKAGVEQNLVDWAKPYMDDKRNFLRIMDNKLKGQYPQEAAFTAANIALKCLSNNSKLRPRMVEVLATLEELQSPKTATKNSKTDLKHHSPGKVTPLPAP